VGIHKVVQLILTQNKELLGKQRVFSTKLSKKQ
jgi:hypothetical protein